MRQINTTKTNKCPPAIKGSFHCRKNLSSTSSTILGGEMLRNVSFLGIWWSSRWKPRCFPAVKLDKSRSLIWWQHVGQPDDVVAWRREQRSYADSWMSQTPLGLALQGFLVGELKTPGSNWHSWLEHRPGLKMIFLLKMEDISAPAMSWIGQNGSKIDQRSPLKSSPVTGTWRGNVWEIIVLRPYSTGWWFQPIWKIFVKLETFPK